MTKSRRKDRVSKDQWLAQALEVFTREGEPGVRIESLARDIGVAKAGFLLAFQESRRPARAAPGLLGA